MLKFVFEFRTQAILLSFFRYSFWFVISSHSGQRILACHFVVVLVLVWVLGLVTFRGFSPSVDLLLVPLRGLPPSAVLLLSFRFGLALPPLLLLLLLLILLILVACYPSLLSPVLVFLTCCIGFAVSYFLIFCFRFLIADCGFLCLLLFPPILLVLSL